MSTTFQTAEVADRSGAIPATLRYYEDIGLLAPTARMMLATGSTTTPRWRGGDPPWTPRPPS